MTISEQINQKITQKCRLERTFPFLIEVALGEREWNKFCEEIKQSPVEDIENYPGKPCLVKRVVKLEDSIEGIKVSINNPGSMPRREPCSRN